MNVIDFSLFNRLSQAKILVVGDVMLDRYWYGETSRISPEAPVPVVKINQYENRVGGGANVARNIASLDGHVGLLGLAGDDEFADILDSLLSHQRITSHIIRLADAETITKLRVISQHQQVVRLDREAMFSQAGADLLEQVFTSIVNDYDCVIFSDYDKGSLRNVTPMIGFAKSLNKLVLVDPKKSDLSVYRGADIIKPNLKEFKQAGGDTSTEEAILASSRQLLAEIGVQSMLLTRSARGMALIDVSSERLFDAQVLEVNDVTGAGDTVIACMALFLCLGAKPEDAALIANLAAGIVVSKLGTACVSPQELLIRIKSYYSQYSVVTDLSHGDTKNHIDVAKQCNEKIVFTNGCFDILHAGHIRYLSSARAMGDKLVVGVNTDDSVKRLKGSDRPINSLDDRMSMLNALAFVDWVIPFGDEDDDTPLSLIKSIRPDFLVKGGDYVVDDIVGSEFVRSYGGVVKVIEFVDGKSTTQMINKIKQSHR